MRLNEPPYRLRDAKAMNPAWSILPILLATLLLTGCGPMTARSPAPPLPSVRNLVDITHLGSVAVSDGSWNQHFAVDKDIDTWWSADDFAPQWFELEFPEPVKVAGVEFAVAMVNPGPARHKIILENAEGDIVVWHRFDTENAVDGDTFTLNVEPPRLATRVRILTTRHQGWVAYRELRISGRSPPYVSVFASGLARPVYVTHAGDDSGRLFVLEQHGRIRIVKKGVLLEDPFLDISGNVLLYQQVGFHGIAFPPDYDKSGKFYVTYTSAAGYNTVSRFSLGHTDVDSADRDSEEILASFLQLAKVHPIGTLAFGPHDGYLYVAVGDGQNTFYSYPQSPQDPASLQGKILRIDVASAAGPYSIPPDNPFASSPGHAPEIWALGLRNPWGIAFDQKTGSLFIPDTGHDTQEEVNYQLPLSGGINYGWPCWEGEVRTGACELDAAAKPVAAYARDQGCAVVGGAVHNGAFIYADFCSGKVWALRRQRNDKWVPHYLFNVGVPVGSIGADQSGNLYAVGYADGKIYMLHLD